MNSEKKKITFTTIGLIRTPYKSSFCPYQPVEREEGEARVILFPEYQAGLEDLKSFKYIYVLYYCHLCSGEPSLKIHPPWAKGQEVGLFASRAPERPNPIGLSVVELKRIENFQLITNLIDVWDETPLLDVKPYIKELDQKHDANYGWLEEVDGYHHLIEHIRGIPHKH